MAGSNFIMTKKTLIINGSPRIDGDTATLINELKSQLDGEILEISAYRSNIAPCVDCRKCWDTSKCAVRDDMDLIYADDFDQVVLASPVYYADLPGPVLSLMSRFQNLHSAIVEGKPLGIRPKKAGLILTAGGNGNEAYAQPHIFILFRMLNAKGFEDHTVKSVKTDTIPAAEDAKALADVEKLAQWLNEA